MTRIYVKHKDRNVYGELINDMFIRHKWELRNYRWKDIRTKAERRKKLPIKFIKEYVKKELETEETKIWGSKTKRYIHTEFIHCEPQQITPLFFDSYTVISYDEYVKCINNDNLK